MSDAARIAELTDALAKVRGWILGQLNYATFGVDVSYPLAKIANVIGPVADAPEPLTEHSTEAKARAWLIAKLQAEPDTEFLLRRTTWRGLADAILSLHRQGALIHRHVEVDEQETQDWFSRAPDEAAWRRATDGVRAASKTSDQPQGD